MKVHKNVMIYAITVRKGQGSTTFLAAVRNTHDALELVPDDAELVKMEIINGVSQLGLNLEETKS